MISAEESEKIEELRSVLPPGLLTKDRFEDDYYLIRWLRARNCNVEKASSMLQASMKWRKDMGADECLEKQEDIPDKIKKSFPVGLLGRDHEDCLVFIYPLGRYRHRPMMESDGMQSALRYNMIYMEKVMELVKKTEEEIGKKGLRLVQIVDMEHYSYKEFAYGLSREYLITTNKNFDQNYPCMLKSLTIINAPKIFAMLFSMIKPLLSKETLSKISIYGGGKPEEEAAWKRVILSKCDPERVPIRWGGVRKASDEFCSEDPEIWIGAPIPLQLFTNEQEFVGTDGLKVECIRARDKHQIIVPFSPSEYSYSDHPRFDLRWKLKVESHDICVNITFNPDNNSSENSKGQKPIVCLDYKIDSKQGIQEGSYPCTQGMGTFILTFDNRYSFTRSKTVAYSIGIFHVSAET